MTLVLDVRPNLLKRGMLIPLSSVRNRRDSHGSAPRADDASCSTGHPAHSGTVNLTLAVLTPALVAVVAVLAMLDSEISDSLELAFFREEFKDAPVGRCTMQIDLLLDGERLTLCAGANRPYLGRHSKYLNQC